MGDLSKNFNRSEFQCSCGCGLDTVDAELITVSENVRNYFRMPVKINSGIRCTKHNREVGGAENSQHVLGKAADIVVKAVKPGKVYRYLDRMYTDKYGIGLYEDKGFVHIDVRKNKARWGI